MQVDKVTVIIPNFNNEKYIQQAVESVVNQTYPNVEALVIDDCSTDGSRGVLEALMQQYSNVHVIFLEKNGGVSHARNVGIQNAQGTYVSFLDADDYYWSAEKIEKEMQLLKEKETQGENCAVYSKVVHVDEKGKRIGLQTEERIEGDIYLPLLKTSNTALVPRDYCIKTKCLQEADGFDESMRLYEDYDLVVRLSRNMLFFACDVEGTAYRIHGSGASTQNQKRNDRALFDIFNRELKTMRLRNKVLCLVEKYLSFYSRRFKSKVFDMISKYKMTAYHLYEKVRDPLLEYKFFDIIALYLKTYLYEKKKIVRGTVTGVREYCQKQQFSYTEYGKEVCNVYKAPIFEVSIDKNEEFTAPDLYIAQLRNVQVIGGCGMIRAGEYILHDKLAEDTKQRLDYCSAPVCKRYQNQIYIKCEQDVLEIERGIYLVGVAPFNYYHFMVEIAARLSLLRGKYEGYSLIVDDAIEKIPQLAEVLKQLNARDYPVVTIAAGQIVRVHELIYPSEMVAFPVNLSGQGKYQMKDYSMSFRGIDYIRDRMLNNLETQKTDRKVFLSRKNQERNRLMNEEKIAEMFEKSGFEIIYPELLNLQEQIAVLGSAKYIVGATGGAMTNLIFCNSGTKVACIMPEEFEFYLYSTIAKYLKLDFVFLNAEIKEEGENIALSRYALDEAYCERFLTSLRV